MGIVHLLRLVYFAQNFFIPFDGLNERISSLLISLQRLL